MVGVGIGLPIVWLAGTTDYWIVPQAMGWEHFLNGIEYFVYGTLYVGILPLFILVWNIGKFTVGKVKSARNQA